METLERLITVSEGAAYMRVSREHLYRIIGAGGVPVYRIGRVLRLDLNDLKAWARRER